MTWTLVFSMVWVVNGAPTETSAPSTISFKSLDLCEAAAASLVAEMAEPIEGDVKTYVRAVCIQRK